MKAVLFDWDGTLVDTCGMVLDAHNHVRKIHNLPLWEAEDIFGRVSRSARETYPKIYGDRAAEAQKQLYEFVDKHHLEYLEVLDGASAILGSLAEKNIPVGVVSNKRHEVLLKEITQLGWDRYIKAAVGAGEAEEDKPSAQPFRLAMRRVDEALTPRDILYVGDTETDMLCARNTGVECVYIHHGNPRAVLLETYAPSFSCANLSELQDYLSASLEKKAC